MSTPPLNGCPGEPPATASPVQVARIELALPADKALSGIAGAFGTPPTGHIWTLVRLHGHPLGMVEADIEVGERAADILIAAARRELAAAVADHIARDGFGDLASAASAFPPRCLRPRLRALTEPPLISVVIATRRRPDRLARCLESVAALPYARFELVVVDSDPLDDEAARLVRARFGAQAAYLREPSRGLAVARNRGLAAASGDIVAFIDDDVIVDRDWLGAVAESFARPDVGCVTGLILPAQFEAPAQVTIDAHGRLGEGYAAGRTGSSDNMAFRVEALRRISGFDTAGGAASVARGGDALLASFRTAAAGYSVAYQPAAIVWRHHCDAVDAPHRRSAHSYSA